MIISKAKAIGSLYPNGDWVLDGDTLNWFDAVSYTHLTLPTICSV